MQLSDLIEIRAIETLKYRYLRCVDLKEWSSLEEVLTEDATATYAGGNLSVDGRAAIIAFLSENLATRLTSHKCHHPEIDLVGEDRATGVWALEDVVIDTEFGVTIRGSAYYDDHYRKIDGRWLIEHTGYRRVYEELETRRPREEGGPHITADWWKTDGRSKLGVPR